MLTKVRSLRLIDIDILQWSASVFLNLTLPLAPTVSLCLRNAVAGNPQGLFATIHTSDIQSLSRKPMADTFDDFMYNRTGPAPQSKRLPSSTPFPRLHSANGAVCTIGLEILYARPSPNADLGSHPGIVAKELRERFWIRAATNAGSTKTWATVGAGVDWSIERDAVGRTRDDPGDGFRYAFYSGTDGTYSRVEWFEVTEVFEGAEPGDIESFMRLQHGGRANPGFNPRTFLADLDLGMPKRAAQRRAADKVVAAVASKIGRPSYSRMCDRHGYGTLVVGLPLWFATEPLDPYRSENAVDDFMTRVSIGLEPFVKQLKQRSCPFWRIVVVWNRSRASSRQWKYRANLAFYAAPSNQAIRGLPLSAPLPLVMLDLMDQLEPELTPSIPFNGFSCKLSLSRRDKNVKPSKLRLPPAVEAVMRHLETSISPLQNRCGRLKTAAAIKLCEVLCFLRVHRIVGLRRWSLAKLSPAHRLSRFFLRIRAIRLYRASVMRSSGDSR